MTQLQECISLIFTRLRQDQKSMWHLEMLHRRSVLGKYQNIENPNKSILWIRAGVSILSYSEPEISFPPDI